MKFNAAIFDMDGTLLDSMHIWTGLGHKTLTEMGYTPRPDLDAHLKVMTLRQGAAYCQETYHLPMSAEAFAEQMTQRVERFYAQEVQPKPGVERFLSTLRQRGIPMYVATATDRPLAEAALGQTGLMPYFQGLLTCQDVGRGKEDPAVFQEALSRLGSRRDATWVFEDALHAIQTAKRAGFPVAAIYDPSAQEDQAAIQSLADYYFRSFEDLPLP